MVYVKTDVQKGLILRNDKSKLEEEVSAGAKSMGLESMIPQNNQDPYRQMEDMKNEKSHIQELMREAREKRLKKNEEERKAKRKPINEQLRLYLQKAEREAMMCFNSRRIVFRDGGFDEYENRVRMPSFRVLLRRLETGTVEKGGILVNSDKERFPRFVVISCGEGCEDVIPGDVVVVQPHSGTEVVSKDIVYRIVLVDEILGLVEENS